MHAPILQVPGDRLRPQGQSCPQVKARVGLRDGTLRSRGGLAALHISGLASRGLDSQVEQTYLQLLQGISAPHFRRSHKGSEGELGAVLPIPGATGLRTPPEVQMTRSCSYADPAWSTWWLLQLLPVRVGTQAPLRWPPAQGSWDSQGGTPRVHGRQISWGSTQAPVAAGNAMLFSRPGNRVYFPLFT